MAERDTIRPGSIGGLAFAFLQRASPLQLVAPHLRSRLGATLVFAFALAFLPRASIRAYPHLVKEACGRRIWESMLDCRLSRARF